MAQTSTAKKKPSTASKTSAKSKTTAKKPSTKGKAPVKAPEPKGPSTARIIAAAVFAVLGILVFIGYFLKEGSSGFLVRAVFNAIKGLIGYGVFAAGPILLIIACAQGFGRSSVAWRTTAGLLFPVSVSAFADLLMSRLVLPETENLIASLYREGIGLNCGGVFGGLIAFGLEEAISSFAAGALLFILCLVFLLGALNVTGKKLRQWFGPQDKEYVPDPEPVPVNKRRRPEPQSEAEPETEPAEPEPKPKKKLRPVTVPMEEPDYDIPEPEPEPAPPKKKAPPKRSEEPVLTGRSRVRPAPEEKKAPPAEEKKPAPPVTDKVEPLPVEEAETFIPTAPVSMSGNGSTAAAEVSDPPAKSQKRLNSAEMEQQTAAVAEEIAAGSSDGEYERPPIFLLKKGHSARTDAAEELRTNRERLENAIKSFGVSARVVDTTHGPTVTRYDLELSQGVKLSRLTNLAGDIALALGVVSVRIAPIPDKISTVGIEVPNKVVSTVYLRDIIDSPKFARSKSALTFAIGKDIGGEAVIGNISKLPHLLIAGTTGSGKSVCMNSLIISLLYKSDPDDVKLIMIDPKMVEMGVYNGIPHLFIPVVTDPKKAAGALQWAVTEMLKRYRLFSELGVRSLDAYNQHLMAQGEKKLPNVVVVIDELADLMLVASKDVEESICRVAQMGRAAGMHLVIATQRPSADVITGLMKANIPSRIAFAVSSGLESRIILDNVGAEKLIGMGDMLFAPIGCGKPQRVQGAFVSDEERDAIVSFIKEQATAEYREDIMAQIDKAAEEKATSGKGAEPEPNAGKPQYDELLPQAADVIFDTKQASVSMLQRRLKLGYSRAARIIDQMEEMGILGPFEGSKPRQILITREQWMEMQMAEGTAPTESYNPEDFDN